jgi:hypothetical protein
MTREAVTRTGWAKVVLHAPRPPSPSIAAYLLAKLAIILHGFVCDESAVALDDDDVLTSIGRIERQCDRGLMTKVPQLLSRRHREDDDFWIAPTEPDGDVVRPSIRSSRAKPDDGFGRKPGRRVEIVSPGRVEQNVDHLGEATTFGPKGALSGPGLGGGLGSADAL